MSHIPGQQDSDLHHEDGSHRSTAPTTDGRAVALHERRIEEHLALHEARNVLMVKVTPTVAREMLTKFQESRQPNMTVVERYARTMLQDRWQYTTDGTMQYPDGSYRNGRMVLMAVIKAGTVNPNITIDWNVYQVPDEEDR